MAKNTSSFERKHSAQSERPDGRPGTAQRPSAAHIARRRKRWSVRTAIRIGMLVCAFVFVAGGVIAGKAWLDDKKANQAYTELRLRVQETSYARSVSAGALTLPAAEDEAPPAPSMDFDAIKEINPEIVAWLICDGTVIDYPVLHTVDNDYYMNHLYTKEENRIGSLFVDYRNTGLFTERNTVIYGHNMKSGAMFKSLSEYKQQDYYDAFPTIMLYTPDGDYTIELFSGTVEDGNYEFIEFGFENDAAFLEYAESIRARSTFRSNVVLAPTDRIVTLCTCSYEWNNARYMLMGRLVRV